MAQTNSQKNAAKTSEFLGGASVQQALTASEGGELFQLAPLPYEFGALEPVIDHESMKWHHGVFHRAYVDRLNEALKGASVRGQSLESILNQISKFSEDVRLSAGGHWNHTFLWSVMTDKQEDHEITPAVMHAIESSFGTMEKFKSEFIRAGVEHVGSGWLWVLATPEGRLKILTTSANDNPLMNLDLGADGATPILVCDLWEHAYHLKFKARRDEYLRKFLAIVNWARVDLLLGAARPAEAPSAVH